MTFSDFLMHGAASPDAALLTCRVAVGGFFAISGAHKLFHPARRATLRETLFSDHVPLVPFMHLIPLGELFGGLGVMFGALTVIAAAGLLALCVGACLLDGLKRIPAMHPLNAADWVDDVLYLPEVLYAVILAALIALGPGAYSMDALAVLWLNGPLQ